MKKFGLNNLTEMIVGIVEAGEIVETLAKGEIAEKNQSDVIEKIAKKRATQLPKGWTDSIFQLASLMA